MTKGRNWELQHGDSSTENRVMLNALFIHTWLPGRPTPLLQWLRVWMGDVFVLVGQITFSGPVLVLSALWMTEFFVFLWAEQLCAASHPFDTGFLRKIADSHTHTPYWFKIISNSKRLGSPQSAFPICLTPVPLPPFRSQSSILPCFSFFTRLSETIRVQPELWTRNHQMQLD